MGVDHVKHSAGARPPTHRDNNEPRGSGQVAATLCSLVVRSLPFQVAPLQELLRGKVRLARTPAVRVDRRALLCGWLLGVDRRALLCGWLLGHERRSPSPSERHGGDEEHSCPQHSSHFSTMPYWDRNLFFFLGGKGRPAHRAVHCVGGHHAQLRRRPTRVDAKA
eukprot:scaffold3472_cov52-Phaeocystis_antarctica.AAC.2